LTFVKSGLIFSALLRWMKGALLFILLWNFCGCGYDHRLMEPDCCGGGYNLTLLGRLVYGPWQTYLNGNNEAVFFEGKEISSIGTDYSPLQKNLVFELLQDGTVKFWFKSDYDSSLKNRTSPDANGIQSSTNDQPKDNEIKKVYNSGTWRADFRDSSLKIDFGKDGNGIPALIGKYKNLGSTYFDFQEISYFDSTYPGGKKTLKKVITTHYNHPWIHNF
jgi:hypothetical protein